ncbi:MAG TPA: DUF1385 domain-containing protein [Actinomycetota bacterium]|nr:DUF1385 domain-containing protein [Actinomycetota bacterium]
MAEASASPAKPATHLYGGQAVVEGVMMRGQDHWAVAVREPAGDIYVESHDVDSIAARQKIWRAPFFRGILVLGQSLRIGIRALMIASNHATDEDEELTSTQIGVALTIALVAFVAIFVLGPTTLFVWLQDRVNAHGVLVNVAEGVFRVGLFVGYLWVLGRTKDIHRVFEYHGAEHKTIAAYEHTDELVPEHIDHYPKEHVRCGTNFLIIVMIITVFVFSLFGTPGLLWRLLSRVIAIPIIAGLAYEALRLGARYPDSVWMRTLMRPGIWLQKITTQQPDVSQIEVAVASFREVLRREADAPSPERPS